MESKVEMSDEAELFNELSSSSVMRVDASIRRPPAVSAQAWTFSSLLLPLYHGLLFFLEWCCLTHSTNFGNSQWLSQC